MMMSLFLEERDDPDDDEEDEAAPVVAEKELTMGNALLTWFAISPGIPLWL